MKKKSRPRHTVAEYFLAAVGLGLVALIVAIIATSNSCRVRLSPELGGEPKAPFPTATPASP